MFLDTGYHFAETTGTRERKVESLERALAPYDAWGSGIRRDESPARASIGVVEWDAKRGKVKVNPLATWTTAQAEAYLWDNGVLVNTLLTGRGRAWQRIVCGSGPAPTI